MSGESKPEERRSGGLVAFLGSALGSGASLGLGIISATALAVDAIRSEAGPGKMEASFYLLAGGTLAGILAAGVLSWRLLAPVESPYRRGALGMVCGFATVLLMLVCIPIHQAWGRTGLLVLVAVSVGLAGFLAYRARRLGYGR